MFLGDVIQREMPLKAPMYIRKKRIAHARDFQKFLKVTEREKYCGDLAWNNLGWWFRSKTSTSS